ncbi:MAG: J domain-containing protein [Actinomycetia bacterium]|nr:J domain-containing protein [Actinomycetes bacterium]
MNERFRRWVAGMGVEDDLAQLDDDEHSWWAKRTQLSGIAGTDEAPPETEEEPSPDQWDSALLFSPIRHDPRNLLGLEPNTTWDDVKARHRELTARYHPDRFVSASSVERTEAAEILERINEAVDELRREMAI